jgi:hypothetical protein
MNLPEKLFSVVFTNGSSLVPSFHSSHLLFGILLFKRNYLLPTYILHNFIPSWPTLGIICYQYYVLAQKSQSCSFRATSGWFLCSLNRSPIFFSSYGTTRYSFLMLSLYSCSLMLESFISTRFHGFS